MTGIEPSQVVYQQWPYKNIETTWNNMHEYLYIYYQNSGKVPANYGALTTSVSTPSSPLADGNSRKAQGAPPVPPVVVINGGCVGRSQHDSLGEKQFLGFEIFRNMTQTSSTLRHARPWSFLPRWCGPIIRQTRSAWVLERIFGGWLKVIGENTWFFWGVSWWKHLFLLGVECWLFRLKKWCSMIFHDFWHHSFGGVGFCEFWALWIWRYQNDATLSPG